MSVQALAWVLDHSTAEGSERLVLISIANHADHHGANSWPGIDLMAHEARRSPTRVKQAVKALAKKGHIRIEPRKGGPPEMRADRRPNRYTILGMSGHAPDDGHTGASRPDEPSTGATQVAGRLERGPEMAPHEGHPGAGNDGHPGDFHDGHPGDREPSGGTVLCEPSVEPSPSFIGDDRESSPGPIGNEGASDVRLVEVWPAVARLKLAARSSDEPIINERAWLRNVAGRSKAEMLVTAEDLVAWHPTITTDDLAAVLVNPRSSALDRHPRRRCPECDDQYMVDTGAGYAPCGLCRPGARRGDLEQAGLP